jgi:hypothetical protein
MTRIFEKLIRLTDHSAVSTIILSGAQTELQPPKDFFGTKPGEMFDFLLGAVDLPGRPARRRL